MNLQKTLMFGIIPNEVGIFIIGLGAGMAFFDNIVGMAIMIAGLCGMFAHTLVFKKQWLRLMTKIKEIDKE